MKMDKLTSMNNLVKDHNKISVKALHTIIKIHLPEKVKIVHQKQQRTKAQKTYKNRKNKVKLERDSIK